MRKLLLVGLLLLIAVPASAQSLTATIARANGRFTAILADIDAGQGNWTNDYPVQCLASHTIVMDHGAGDADTDADAADRRPAHRDDMTNCLDDLGLRGTLTNLPFVLEVHSVRCQSIACGFRGWRLIAYFDFNSVRYTRTAYVTHRGTGPPGRDDGTFVETPAGP